MNKIVLLMMFVLLFASFSYAAELQEWDTEVVINTDRTADFSVTFIYNSTAEKSDYFVHTDIKDIVVKSDGNPINCDVKERGIGTSIVCDDINTRKVTYKFTALNLVNLQGQYLNFDYRFVISTLVQNFSLTIKLPVGYAIVSKGALENTGLSPFEPEYGQKGSDGRHIFVKWEEDKPQLGDRLDVSIIYERSFIPNLNLIGPIVLIVILLMIIIFIISRKKKSNIEDILPVLTNSERKVMKILLEEKKEMKQNKIVKKLDVSKSKVSRIIKNLKERNLIEVRKKGRSNRIKLKKQKKGK